MFADHGLTGENRYSYYLDLQFDVTSDSTGFL